MIGSVKERANISQGGSFNRLNQALCSFVQLARFRGRILVNALLLLLYDRALDNDARGRVESVPVPLRFSGQGQVLGEVIPDNTGVWHLVLLVAFLSVLHVVESARVAEIVADFLLVVVGTAGLRLSSVIGVAADVLDVVVYLTQLLVDLLVLSPIDVVLQVPLVLLMRSDLNPSFLLVLRLGSAAFPLESRADIAGICIDKDVGDAS